MLSKCGENTGFVAELLLGRYSPGEALGLSKLRLLLCKVGFVTPTFTGLFQGLN